jgi:hypothetical protein
MASNGWVEGPERESIVGGGVRQLSAQRPGRVAQAGARSLSGRSGLARTVPRVFDRGEPKSESGVTRNRR